MLARTIQKQGNSVRSRSRYDRSSLQGAASEMSALPYTSFHHCTHKTSFWVRNFDWLSDSSTVWLKVLPQLGRMRHRHPQEKEVTVIYQKK